MFDNTIKYSRDHIWITLISFVILFVFNVYITAGVAPEAPGFGIIIGTLGGVAGVLVGLAIAPVTETSKSFGASMGDILGKL